MSSWIPLPGKSTFPQDLTQTGEYIFPIKTPRSHSGIHRILYAGFKAVRPHAGTWGAVKKHYSSKTNRLSIIPWLQPFGYRLGGIFSDNHRLLEASAICRVPGGQGDLFRQVCLRVRRLLFVLMASTPKDFRRNTNQGRGGFEGPG